MLIGLTGFFYMILGIYSYKPRNFSSAMLEALPLKPFHMVLMNRCGRLVGPKTSTLRRRSCTLRWQLPPSLWFNDAGISCIGMPYMLYMMHRIEGMSTSALDVRRSRPGTSRVSRRCLGTWAG